MCFVSEAPIPIPCQDQCLTDLVHLKSFAKLIAYEVHVHAEVRNNIITD